jgi:hypothetical protein
MTRTDWLRLILAAVVAPIIAGGIACAIVAALAMPEFIFEVNVPAEGSESTFETRPATVLEIARNLFGMGAFGAIVSAVVGIPGMLLLGLPAHMALLRRGQTQLIAYALSGLLAGTVIMLVYFGRSAGLSFLKDPDALLLSGPVAGTLGATLFWLIRRPDKMSPRRLPGSVAPK